ncbi:hypothetical protein BH18CHL2_BH18CHL2_13080 [soil metagenome]
MTNEPRPHGTVRVSRARPPRRRTLVGPMAFVLAVILLLAGGILYARPLAVNAIVDIAAERDTLLRQPLVRAIVAPQVGAQPDMALDSAGELRGFDVKRGETAAHVGARLES